jgi:hypothetical membrane protein
VTTSRQALAIGGILGPAAFVGAWLTGAARTPGYSSVNNAISRLAAVHAPTRVLMTGGFVGLTIGVGAFSVALKDRLPGKAWLGAATTATATLAVAALPLDHSSTVDLLHGAAATIGYISLASIPLLASSPIKRLGYPRVALASRGVAAFSAGCLAATVAGPAHGLFQRTGLSASDAWIVVCAIAMLNETRRTR